MYRSSWELAAYVHHHIAELAGECQGRSRTDRDDDGPARLLTQLRHRLGIALIQVGHALSGGETSPATTTTPLARVPQH